MPLPLHSPDLLPTGSPTEARDRARQLCLAARVVIAELRPKKRTSNVAAPNAVNGALFGRLAVPVPTTSYRAARTALGFGNLAVSGARFRPI